MPFLFSPRSLPYFPSGLNTLVLAPSSLELCPTHYAPLFLFLFSPSLCPTYASIHPLCITNVALYMLSSACMLYLPTHLRLCPYDAQYFCGLLVLSESDMRSCPLAMLPRFSVAVFCNDSARWTVMKWWKLDVVLTMK